MIRVLYQMMYNNQSMNGYLSFVYEINLETINRLFINSNRVNCKKGQLQKLEKCSI